MYIIKKIKGNCCKVTQNNYFRSSSHIKAKLELNKNHRIEHQNLYKNDYKPSLNTRVFTSKFECITLQHPYCKITCNGKYAENVAQSVYLLKFDNITSTIHWQTFLEC